ncbi:unnamed protein product [Mytilus coruscus]|uniref:Reverse transcriptase domain-containing protein n=1 Tax=Mytilus coruscus TaxID=42192 RepID=A0A6J8BJZ0_MYTCO|nr:unnamed protein product [Mytilus coruscus]
MANFNVISLNCNGLCDINKRNCIFSLCNDRYYDIICLQETFWNDLMVERIKKDKIIWNGDIFYSNSGNNRQGVAILVSKKLKNMFSEVANENGRYIHINGKINDEIIDIYNIYAPNNVNERCDFFLKCKYKISNEKYVLVAGDFNTTLSSLDKSGKTLHCNDKAVKTLYNIMQEKGLCDIWRNRNVDIKTFSRKQVVQGFLTQSRIDYLLVSTDLKSCIKNIHYKDTSFSDHSIVSMKNKIQELSVKSANGIQINSEQFLELKTQLEDIETYKCKGVILRSKSQWALESDRNTAYFLKLEKYRQNKNVISEIKDCDGKIVTETNDLLNVIHDYYKHLFSCVSIDMHSIDELLNNVNVKIDDEDVEMCDDEINIEEIEKSFKGMKKGKTPGPDGKDISDTVASVRDIMDLVEMDDIECYLLKLDQEKAFDRAGHEYLFAVLDKFGFGNKFKNWIKIFYTNSFSSVKCSGFLTPYFRLKNSVKQGCPISALLYVLLAEPLSIAFKKNCEIRGVVIPNTNVEEKVFVHADDTTLTLVDKNSVSETFRVLELYEKASGAKLNKEKSEVLALGKGKICSNDLNIWKIKECDEVLQLLGIWVGKNKTLCKNLNWESKVQSITKILNFWKMRHLTLHGRAFIQAGVCKIKDIAYECKPGFLKESYIQEIVSEKFPEVSENKILHAVRNVLETLPDEYKVLVEANVHVSKTPVLNPMIKDGVQICSLPSTTSFFYQMLVSNLSREPKPVSRWRLMYADFDLRKVQKIMNFPFLQSDCREIAFKFFHRIIFTKERLFKCRITKDSQCPICSTLPESLNHLILECTMLTRFNDFVKNFLHNILYKSSDSYINDLSFAFMCIFGLTKQNKYINYYFVNSVLAIRRFCIVKRRNIAMLENKIIDIEQYFKSTLVKNVNYAYEHYKRNNALQLFEKYYSENNPVLIIRDNQIQIDF